MRGIEGDESANYFGVFGLLLSGKSSFSFDGNNCCPPRDGVNALLSFVYSIFGKDICGALQGMSLDSQFRFCMPNSLGTTICNARYSERIFRVMGRLAGAFAD